MDGRTCRASATRTIVAPTRACHTIRSGRWPRRRVLADGEGVLDIAPDDLHKSNHSGATLSNRASDVGADGKLINERRDLTSSVIAHGGFARRIPGYEGVDVAITPKSPPLCTQPPHHLTPRGRPVRINLDASSMTHPCPIRRKRVD